MQTNKIDINNGSTKMAASAEGQNKTGIAAMIP